MKTAELDTIYLDLAAGINAAAVTCHDDSASVTELLKAQHALDAMAGMLSRVRHALPEDVNYEGMFAELGCSLTSLRLTSLERLYPKERAA